MAEGIKYDQEKPRFDLIDPVALEGLAKVLTFGANKYTQRGECDCHVSIVKEILKFGPKDYVNLVTTLVYSHVTIEKITENIKDFTDLKTKQNLLSTNVSIWLEILTKKKQNVDLILNANMELGIYNSMLSLHNLLVDYVEVQKNSVLTTTTQQEQRENDFVSRVTLRLDSLKEKIGLLKHSNTCKNITEIKHGTDNWRGGIAYSRIIAAMERHLNAIKRGEDEDPESNLPHIDHVLCNAMFLSFFSKHRRDLDDRWSGWKDLCSPSECRSTVVK